MSEDAPELTAELVVDGVVPSQPVISSDGCGVAYVVAPARPGTAQRRRHLRPHRPRASPARRAPRRLARRTPDRQPHRPGRALPARTRDQRPPQRAHLARHRPGPGHQPRRGPPAIRPRLPGRRRPLALRHLKPQRRGHFKPSQQRRTRTRWGQIKPSGRGQIRVLAHMS